MAHDPLRQRPVELVEGRDAELCEVALCHRHSSLGEPNIVPETPPGVFALEHHEGEFVTWRAVRFAVERFADCDPRDVAAARQKREVWCGLGFVPSTLQTLAVAV